MREKKRIFWLGMHKVLVCTELATLRDLEYEVFNPPYLSNIQDQSAELDWKASKTTLPEEIHQKLSTYNFFYNSINNETSKILNEYFDAVIVTINPDWLVSILKVFKKTVIYRTFGQIGTLSESLSYNGGDRLIQEHDNFWFLPHCVETASDEQYWLMNRGKIAPYWITDDVLSLRNHWQEEQPKKPEIGLTCPNISNAYYKQHFIYLKSYFEQRCFRYYGAQIEESFDPNLVGTLPRNCYLDGFLSLSGYLYTYRERNVCYLPPIEMMMLGGPVLYFPGSLLHRYFNFSSPGLVSDEDEALRKSKMLIKGDVKFVEEIVASQKDVAERYSKSYGLPIFSSIIHEILDESDNSRSPLVSSASIKVMSSEKNPVLLFAHFRGAYIFSNGEYSTMHGIPRVMRQLVKALTRSDIPVVVTAWPDDLNNTHGFYASHCDNPNFVSVISVEDLGLGLTSQPSGSIRVHNGVVLRSLRFFIRKSSILQNIHSRYVHNSSSLSLFERFITRLYKVILTTQNRLVVAGTHLKVKCVKLISKFVWTKNSPLEPGKRWVGWRYVVVPHYYLFPEVLSANFERILAYIPDYMPHLFKGRDYFPENDLHVKLGHRLAAIATAVLTNSRYTAEYLPDCSLAIAKEKIVMFPMPFLSMSKERHKDKADQSVVSKLFNKNFIFYPTQPHPNKRLDLLIRSWILIRKMRPDLHIQLLLTSGSIPSSLSDLIRKEKMDSFLHLAPAISDSTLSWLYHHATCLTFTSEFEGNFPTQVFEALEYQCPVVAMENPLLGNELGGLSKKLLVAPFADIETFSEYVIYAAENRTIVLKDQKIVLEYLRESKSFEVFIGNILDLDEKMINETSSLKKNTVLSEASKQSMPGKKHPGYFG